MSKKFKIVAIILVVLITGFFIYNYVMTGGARNLEKEKSEFSTSAVVIFGEFSSNSEIATTKYLNKAVEISGKVTNVDENVITLDEKVSCQLLVSEKVEVNGQLKIKGRVTGYDDLLEELKLDQCLIVK
jgi:sRNA-binding regulator protein Hfq